LPPYYLVLTPKGENIQNWSDISDSDVDTLKTSEVHHIGYDVTGEDPKPVNKGTFKNHIEVASDYLDALINDFIHGSVEVLGQDLGPPWNKISVEQP